MLGREKDFAQLITGKMILANLGCYGIISNLLIKHKDIEGHRNNIFKTLINCRSIHQYPGKHKHHFITRTNQL